MQRKQKIHLNLLYTSAAIFLVKELEYELSTLRQLEFAPFWEVLGTAKLAPSVTSGPLG